MIQNQIKQAWNQPQGPSNFTTHQATASEHLVWWEAITAFFKLQKCVLDGSYVHKPWNWLEVTQPQKFISSVFVIHTNLGQTTIVHPPESSRILESSPANTIDIYCMYLYIYIYVYMCTSSSRASRGRKFQKKKNYIAKKEFAYRMCARRPTSAMPKPFLCCERAFCCSMVVMWPVLMHVMSFDVVVMSFDAMWLLVLCHVTWCNAMSCDVPCNGHVVCSKWFCDNVAIQSTILYYKVLLCTTKYYSSTTLYYKVLLQYYSVLLCTTQYYNVLLQYYSVLQSTTPVLLCTAKFYSSTTLYYKVLLQYYSVLQSTTPVLLCTTQYYSSTTLYYKVLL